MKLRGKLYSIILPLAILAAVIIAYFSMLINNTFKESKETFYNQLYSCNSVLINADRDFYQAYSALLSFVVAGARAPAEEKQVNISDYKENMAQTYEGVEEAMLIINSYPEMKNFTYEGHTFDEVYEQFLEHMRTLEGTYQIEYMMGDVHKFFDRFAITRKDIELMEDMVVAYADESENELEAKIRSSIIAAVILAVIVLVVVLAFGSLMIVKIRKSLEKITEKLTVMSNKDLTVEVEILKGKDEIAQLSKAAFSLREQLINMMMTLRNSSGSLFDASNLMSANTEESVTAVQSIDDAAGELAKTSTVQAEDVNNILSEVQKVNQMTSDSVDNTNQLTEACADIEKATQDGMLVVNQLTDITHQSNEAFNLIFDVIQGIDEKTKTINAASDMIADIADQTNLLSLNASIEAARAGEAGRGFAVVADEIRNLAEQSASSAETINRMLLELSASSNNATVQSEKVKKFVLEQLKSVDATKQGFERIVSNVDKVNVGVNNLRDINSELGGRVDDMTHLVESLSASSEENAATAEELSATTSTVMSKIEDLNRTGVDINDSSTSLNDIVIEYQV